MRRPPLNQTVAHVGLDLMPRIATIQRMNMEVSRLALQCVVVSRARALAAWVGEGQPVTAKGVLRRADVAAAATVIGVEIAPRIRSAADVPEIHHPWLVAHAAGWIRTDTDIAIGTQVSGGDLLEIWSAGLTAVLREESHDLAQRGARLACQTILTALSTDPPTPPDQLEQTMHALLDHSQPGDITAVYQAFRRGLMPLDAALQVLAAFGAVDDTIRPTLTPLGRWAWQQLRPTNADAMSAELRPTLFQLKIALDRTRPPVWRRVLIPANASLGDLHGVIQVVLDWDNDHLHMFSTDFGRYADPYHDLDDCDDEDAVRLSRVLPRIGARIGYLYDFGDSWNHTITLERIDQPETTPTDPVCVTGRGDAPVEDWDPDGEEPGTTPFDRDRLNQRLASLTRGHVVD